MRRLILVPMMVLGLSGLAGLAYAAGDDGAPRALGKGPVFDPSAPATAQPKLGGQIMAAGREDDSGREVERQEHRNGEQGETGEGGMEND